MILRSYIITYLSGLYLYISLCFKLLETFRPHRLCCEVDHLLERELGADVAVHDEEGVGVAGEDAVPEVVDAAGGAQRGVLLE